jgi:hypothetical protein
MYCNRRINLDSRYRTAAGLIFLYRRPILLKWIDECELAWLQVELVKPQQ